MKRVVVLLGTFAFCGFLSGCQSDSQADAIEGIVQRMNEAAGDIGNITGAVDKAIKKHETDKTPLDLGDAIKITKNLEKTGRKAQELKVAQLDKTKTLDAEQKDDLAKRYKGRINSAFDDLLKEKKKLADSLQKAETIDKDKTDELRVKIREAEGPFETLARQG